MNSKTLLAASFVLCLFASCKKNSGSGPAGNANRLKWYIEDARATPYNAIDSFSVSYDNDNRITGLTSPSLKTVYAYNGNTSFTMDLYQSGQLNIHEIGFIKGTYVDSTFQYNNTNDSTTEKYIYNGTVLTSKITYNYSTQGSTVDMRENYTYDNNGNLIKTVELDGTGSVNSTTTYTYTDKPFQLTTDPSYIPVQAKNLPATETQADWAGSITSTVTYSYVFDSQGRVTKTTKTLDNGMFVVSWYVYQ